MSERAAGGHAPASPHGDRLNDGDRRPGDHQGGGAGANDPDPHDVLDAVLRENAALQVKVARVSRAISGLVTDLAASRRECRDNQREIESLRGQNAALTAAAPARGDDRVLQGGGLGVAGGVEGRGETRL